MSQGKLRNKIPRLQEALQERVNAYHRFLLRELMVHLYFVQSKVPRIEQEVARLCTIPAVGPRDRVGIASRDRAEHEAVPRGAAPAGWAGLGLGGHEGAGRGKSGKIRKGSLWLRREAQLFVGSLSPAGSAKRIETRDHCGRREAPGHCLLCLARRNLLQRARRSLFQSPEPRRSPAGA
jgi:hypothetical protein